MSLVKSFVMLVRNLMIGAALLGGLFVFVVLTIAIAAAA